jgi:hypothetical protein
MDDLEEEYAENIEKEEEIFLDGLQNKKSLGELEKEYSTKVKEIRRIYEKSLKKDLNEEKEREIQKAKYKGPKSEKEEKEFHVQNLELEENWNEKKQIEITSLGYRTKRKIKNSFGVMIPNSFVYVYYQIKRILMDFSRELREFFKDVWSKFYGGIVNSLSFIKEGFIKIIYDIEKIGNIFKKRGKKEENGGKKENTSKDSGQKSK